MATTEERLADLDTRMNEQTIGMRDLSGQILTLGQQLSAQIKEVDEKLSKRMDRIEGRIDGLDQKLDRRVDTLDAKVDRVMAFQAAMLLALVGGMITVAFRS